MLYAFLRQKIKREKGTGHQWLTPVILATWEAEIWMIVVPGWPGQKMKPSLQNNYSKNGLEVEGGR
jgi:hypothetical protein